MGNSTSTATSLGPEASSPSVNFASQCREYLDARLSDTIKVGHNDEEPRVWVSSAGPKR